MEELKNLKLLTPEEVAEILTVSPATVRGWLRSGALRGIKIQKLWRIREQDFRAFLDDHLEPEQ